MQKRGVWLLVKRNQVEPSVSTSLKERLWKRNGQIKKQACPRSNLGEKVRRGWFECEGESCYTDNLIEGRHSSAPTIRCLLERVLPLQPRVLFPTQRGQMGENKQHRLHYYVIAGRNFVTSYRYHYEPRMIHWR